MPATYTLISSNVLTTTAASITFSSIPATYTDLVLKCSTRLTGTSGTTLSLQLNSDTTANKSFTQIRGDGATAASNRSTAETNFYIGFQNSSSTTANTFTNAEVYIPNYAGSVNKVASSFSAQESNATTAYLYATANLWSATTVISGLTITSAGTFAIDSSFYLYGISNA